MVTSLSWQSAIVVFSILDASFKFARATYLVSGEPRSIVLLEQRAFVGIFSTVIGVFDGLLSASVRMHRKRASCLRFVKDVVSLLRRCGVSRNGQGSRAVPGPCVPGHVWQKSEIARNRGSRWRTVPHTRFANRNAIPQEPIFS